VDRHPANHLSAPGLWAGARLSALTALTAVAIWQCDTSTAGDKAIDYGSVTVDAGAGVGSAQRGSVLHDSARHAVGTAPKARFCASSIPASLTTWSATRARCGAHSGRTRKPDRGHARLVQCHRPA